MTRVLKCKLCIRLVIYIVVAVVVVGSCVVAKPKNVWARHIKPIDAAVVRGFEPPEKRWMAGHRGVDIAGGDGTQVRASESGVVHFAGVIAGRPSVSVMHETGIRTTYQPVDYVVARGDTVVKGQVLGSLRTPEVFDEGGVHWGALRGRQYLNPLDLLGAREIVLKPLATDS